MASSTVDPLVGTRIGKYRVERLLGQGGMGRVYAGVHERIGRPVALKLLRADLCDKPALVKRFFNEAKAAASLNHVNIVQVHDVDQLPDGGYYMVLEYLEGETLAARLARQGRLDPDAVLAIVEPVCDALGTAHELGIIHRDLKPSNIFLVRVPGAGEIVKLVDFGVAKFRLDASGQGSTASGVLLGTPTYMSPEQALGRNAQVGPPSDIYSLGVIAFALLTGSPPFEGGSGELVLAHAQDPPPPIRSARPELPVALERVLAKALAKSREDRFQRAPDMARAFALALSVEPQADLALHALLGPAPTPVANAGGETGGEAAHPPSPPEVTAPRRARVPGASLAILLLIAGGAGLAAIHWARRARLPARRDVLASGPLLPRSPANGGPGHGGPAPPAKPAWVVNAPGSNLPIEATPGKTRSLRNDGQARGSPVRAIAPSRVLPSEPVPAYDTAQPEPP